jgi:hypothetical protein
MTKKLSMLTLLISSITFGADLTLIEQQRLEDIYTSSEIKFQLWESTQSSKTNYSISNIDVGYGKLNVNSGSGRVFVKTDSNNRLKEISVTATVGMLGITDEIKEKISIDDLKKGKDLSFKMAGASSAVMIIAPQAGFSENGGKAKIKIKTSKGWESVNAEILRNTNGQFRIWRGNNSVQTIRVNMRGYSIKNMVVGWYELK